MNLESPKIRLNELSISIITAAATRLIFWSITKHESSDQEITRNSSIDETTGRYAGTRFELENNSCTFENNVVHPLWINQLLRKSAILEWYTFSRIG